MEPIGPMIGAGAKIAEYFGLIEGVNTKVTKLVHQAFISAKDNLTYAKGTTGQNQIEYIKQAKSEFIRAVAVEENENKILSLAGLAMCQYFFCEKQNANNTLGRISDVNLTTSEKAKYCSQHIGLGGFLYGLTLPFSSLGDRVSHFNSTKHSVTNSTNRMINN